MISKQHYEGRDQYDTPGSITNCNCPDCKKAREYWNEWRSDQLKNDEIKRLFVAGKGDILYRIKLSGTGQRFGGWRSYRKRCAKGNCMWPWSMVGSPGVQAVEWKFNEVE